MKKKRKTYSPEEKVYLLKKHLVNGYRLSDLEEIQWNRPLFTRWERSIFWSQGAEAF